MYLPCTPVCIAVTCKSAKHSTAVIHSVLFTANPEGSLMFLRPFNFPSDNYHTVNQRDTKQLAGNLSVWDIIWDLKWLKWVKIHEQHKKLWPSSKFRFLVIQLRNQMVWSKRRAMQTIYSHISVSKPISNKNSIKFISRRKLMPTSVI